MRRPNHERGIAKLLILLVLCATTVRAEEIPLGPADLPRLAGQWQGNLISCDRQDCVRWETGLRLNLDPGPPPTGRWHNESYRADWQSEVRFSGGKLLLRYRDLEIPFTLHRADDGHLRLEGSYRGHWLWFPRINHIRLDKLPAETGMKSLE